jgi:hypothetical protein
MEKLVMIFKDEVSARPYNVHNNATFNADTLSATFGGSGCVLITLKQLIDMINKGEKIEGYLITINYKRK